MDVAFAEGKIGISILNCEASRCSVFSKSSSQQGSFSVDFGELLGIIEGNISRLPFSERLLIESDSPLPINSLTG